MNDEKEELLNEFAAEFVKILNFGNLPREKQEEITRLLQDSRFTRLSTSDMARCPLFSASTFYRHRNGEVLSDQRKGHSGRPSFLSAKQKEEIIKNITKRRNSFAYVTIKWTQNTINNSTNHNISFSFAYHFLKQIGWRSVRTQVHHPMQHSPQIESLVVNFFQYIYDFIEEHQITPANFHIMDETGIVTNMIPKYTFAPKGEAGVILSQSEQTRDSAIVTASGDGSGFLFYVPHRPKQTKVFDGKTYEFREVKGVGVDEMIEWVKAFSKYAQAGSLLIMDNLGAHHNDDVLTLLQESRIHVEFFPVRAAFILSVLDNSLFGVMKNKLSYTEMNSKNKQDKIKEVFQNLVKQKTVLKMFEHCQYTDIFPKYETDNSSLDALFVTIDETGPEYGKSRISKKLDISEVLGFLQAQIYDSGTRALPSVIAFLAMNEKMMSLLDQYVPESNSLSSILCSFQQAKRITSQSKQYKNLLKDIEQIKYEHTKENTTAAALTYFFQLVDQEVLIKNYNDDSLFQSSVIKLKQSGSINESIEEFFNPYVKNGQKVYKMLNNPVQLCYQIQFIDDSEFIYDDIFDTGFIRWNNRI